MKNRFFKAAAVSAICLTALSAIPAFADTGWQKNNDKWYYYTNSGMVTNDWKKDSAGDYYYLGYDGAMLTNSFVDSDYYVGSDGKMAVNTWKLINGSWYYFNSSGKMVKDKVQQLNSAYYAFDDEGKMITGWVYIDGNYYYGSESGALYTNTWKNLQPSEDMTIEDDSAFSDGLKWFYFGSNGKIHKAESGYKEFTINDNRYAFDTNGIMQTGWVEINPTEPVIAGYKFYNDNTSIGSFGAAHKGWLSSYPPEKEESLGNDVQWYYFGTNGVPYYGSDVGSGDDDETLLARIKTITSNGSTHKFLFNSHGNPVYGLRKVQKTNGTVTSMYFGTKNESCLQLGEKNITEADGTKSQFLFDSNGYGINGVKNNKLYYMGKLQKAIDSTYAYYTVDGTTYLVNKSGNIVKNRNKNKDPNEVDFRSDSRGVKDGGTESDSELLVPEFEQSYVY